MWTKKGETRGDGSLVSPSPCLPRHAENVDRGVDVTIADEAAAVIAGNANGSRPPEHVEKIFPMLFVLSSF